jgi:hypothetical protein
VFVHLKAYNSTRNLNAGPGTNWLFAALTKPNFRPILILKTFKLFELSANMKLIKSSLKIKQRRHIHLVADFLAIVCCRTHSTVWELYSVSHHCLSYISNGALISCVVTKLWQKGCSKIGPCWYPLQVTMWTITWQW